MREVLADTGPLYALKDPDDQYHGRAQEDTLRIERERFSVVIAYPTLLEAYNLILRRLTLWEAHQWLNDATSASVLINPTPEDYQSAFARTRDYGDQAISLVDAVTAVLSERLDLQVWTYDYHFDTMGTNVWR